ncbi:MAG: tRNA preQ1(34) S-adenosylmethionine ribosyltransferase-isomerase QueA [Bryobacterales bacterium]|nr:tRNA preQ1(34) S-adenosylmethionine ribosyltransferase-isomerase QueA [Bryobacterales bacterium]
MDPSEFDYELPEERIAQEPLEDRAASRMLVVYRNERRFEDRLFREFPEFLAPGDCLVLNDSRVFPARLFGHRKGVHAHPLGKNNPRLRENLSGRVEVLLLRPHPDDGREWEALVRPGRKMRTGEIIRFEDGVEAEIVARGEYGERTLRFNRESGLLEEFEKIGHIPLPPYIRRPDGPEDRERYQTLFAREKGSAAAPTAGLHFTPGILERVKEAGAEIAFVTLHVGLGTFQPLHEEQLRSGRLHAEFYRIGPEEAAGMRAARRLVAVGTTAVRTIETAGLEAGSGQTDLFIRPGFVFRHTGAMLTNFHLPRTSLLMLVSAFGGRELILGAYRHAVREKYRFYSYGDCMLIL